MESRQKSANPSFGVYEAKTKLSELVERVAAGERIVITRHGVPVAHLVPPPEADADLDQVAQTLAGLRNLGAKSGFDLGPEELRAAIDEGRR